MWKHRAYAKAVIRQETVKLSSTEQLVYLLLADHANVDTWQTFFSIARLADMTQSSAVTVRKSVRKLEKNKLVTAYYSPGKSPVFTVHIPEGFHAESDSSISTVGRAYMPSETEQALAVQAVYMRLTGITERELAMMAFCGLEGLTPEEARTRAEEVVKGKAEPGRAILESLMLSKNTPFATSQGEIDQRAERAARQHREHVTRALDEQRALWSKPRAGESLEAWNERKGIGFRGTDEQLLEWREPQPQALGR